MFDEYHLGVGTSRSLVRYLREVGAGPIALALVLIAFFPIWRASIRFGSPKEEPSAAPTGTASYVRAIGTLYRKTGDTSAALDILLRRTFGRIMSHHRITPEEAPDPESLARLLAARHRHDQAAAVRELIATQSDARRNLVGLVHRIDHLTTQATSVAVQKEKERS